MEAERAMNRALHGSCHVPVAAYAELHARLQLAGLVGSATDGRRVRASPKTRALPAKPWPAASPDLLALGAGEFL